MKRLIVTADDFGLTRNVNKGIIACHREGIVTSTSLMANAEAFADAVMQAKQNPQLAIGVHLNLTEGAPAAEKNSVSSLLNGDGRLRSTPGALARKIALGKMPSIEIERELRAQIERIIGAGIEVAYLDGHKHVQLLPLVFGIVKRLAREYQVPALRCAAEPVAVSALFRAGRRDGLPGIKQFAVGRAFSLLAFKARPALRAARLATPDYFLGITETGRLDIEQLTRILNELPEGTVELMTHPGYADEDLARTPTRLLKQREVELRALTDARTREVIDQRGIKLISYREL